MINRNQCVRRMFEVADVAVLNMELGPVAILPRFAGDGFDLALKFNLADAPQYLAQDGALLIHLEGIIGMLIVASTAPLEIRAFRFHPRSGR